MEVKQLVVLGNTGFIGRAIEKELQLQFSDLGYRGIPRTECDLTRPEQLAELAPLFNNQTVLIVCSGIKRQFGDTAEIFELNLRMVFELCRMLKKFPVGRILYLSSAAVYGEAQNHASLNESSAIDPGSLYGVAKFASERVLARIATEISASLVLLRPPLVYGKGDTSKGYGPAEFEQSLRSSREIALWGDGSELREFVYVGDLARAVAMLAANQWSGVLNPVSGESRTYRDCAEIMQRILGVGKIVEKSRSKQKVNHVFDPSRLHSVIPDFKFHSLEEGLSEMLMD